MEMRRQATTLYGKPLYIRAIHLNTLESFGSFAVAACLAQSIEPTNAEVVNLLVLHVLLKVFVYVPAYWFGIVQLRGLSHFGSLMASALVCWKLAFSAT